MPTSVVRAERGREKRAGVRAPRDLGCVEETAERLARMRQPLRLGRQLGEPGGQDLAAIGVVEIDRERADGPSAEVEAAVRIAARGQEEQGAADGAASFLAVEGNPRAGDRREDDDRDREAVLVALGERALEVGKPGRGHAEPA